MNQIIEKVREGNRRIDRKRMRSQEKILGMREELGGR